MLKINEMKKIFFLLSLIMVGCQLNPTDYSQANDEEIQIYLEENNLEATKTRSGLYYHMDVEGSGHQAQLDDVVMVKYQAYSTEGIVYLNYTKGAVQIDLTQYIEGFQEGVSYMKEGGKSTLYIPAALAFGDRDHQGIPKGSVLIYEVELLEIL